ncbi:MAG: hypothetical protein ACKKL4_01640 [Patescibacteria group bacterium]
MRQKYKHWIQDTIFIWGWGSLCIFIVIGLLLAVVAVKATSQELDPIEASYREHTMAIEKINTAMVSIDDLLEERDCRMDCRYAMAEITLYQSKENGDYGMLWTSERAFHRYLSTDADELPEDDFALTAEWTLEELGMLEHHRPLGSVMRLIIFGIIWDMGHEDPRKFLASMPEWEIAEFLATEVLPRYQRGHEELDKLLAQAD